MSLSQKPGFVKRIDLLSSVRGELLRRGMTLTEWAASRGYQRVTVYRAIQGKHLGHKANAIRETVLNELGVAL